MPLRSGRRTLRVTVRRAISQSAPMWGRQLEARVGGKIAERTRDGKTHIWGTVLVWEAPERLVFTWHPGREESTAQQVEVRFTPSAGGSTVSLTHTGWEVLGDVAAETRDGYDSGWEFVFVQHYARATKRP